MMAGTRRARMWATRRSGALATVCALVIATALAGACAREPTTPEEKRAHGMALVRAMSDRLSKATAFTVKTRDTRTRSSQSRPIQTERTFWVRRPDRAAFTLTGDQLDVRGWYADGKVTLASPNAKVWARVRGDATLDGTLDRLAERFEIQMPMADFFYTEPYAALMSDGMKGGYIGRETVGKVDCAHVSFADDIVEWHLWLPVSGDPLPKKYRITAKRMRGQPTSEVLFLHWDLSTPVADSEFVPQVPPDFERIAMAARQVEPRSEPAATGARP